MSESPLFEPEEQYGFDEEEDALLPAPAVPVQVAPVAPPMHFGAAATVAQSKKRKGEVQ
jgi:hypothetical protein